MCVCVCVYPLHTFASLAKIGQLCFTWYWKLPFAHWVGFWTNDRTLWNLCIITK